MPKEVIRSRYGYSVQDQPEPTLEVGWGRESEHVQVGVLEGREEGDVRTPGEGGLFIQLDRYGINRLIVSLRKARDTAFGRDA